MQEGTCFSHGNCNKEERSSQSARGFQRLHWGWHHGGTSCFGDVCTCEWLKPLSSF